MFGVGTKDWAERDNIATSGFKTMAALEEITGRALVRTRWGIRMLSFTRDHKHRDEDPTGQVTLMRSPWLLMVRCEMGSGELLCCKPLSTSVKKVYWCTRCQEAVSCIREAHAQGHKPTCQKCSLQKTTHKDRTCVQCCQEMRGQTVSCAGCKVRAHRACAAEWSYKGARILCTRPSCIP